MGIDQVHAYIDRHTDELVELLKRLINQRSTSSDGCGVRECAEILKDLLNDMGMDARMMETEGYPYVFGEYRSDCPKAPVIVIYNHFDVQPSGSESAWDTPPFCATLKNGRIYGRGAGDNKGQLIANLFGVFAWLKTNKKIPVNVKFIFDSEEEIGCRSFRSFLEKYPRLFAGDVAIISDSGIHPSGAPFILYGVRGSLTLSLHSVTSDNDHHSGNKGGVIPEASWELIDVLASMRDTAGNVIIDGFFDGIAEPTQRDIQMIEHAPYDPDALARTYALKAPITLSKREDYTNLMFKPTLSILSMNSGRPKDGKVPGSIPGHAQALLNVRFPYGQTGEHLFSAIERHVKRRNSSIDVIYHGSIPAARTFSDLPVIGDIKSAVESSFGKKAIELPSMGASWGSFYLWEQFMHMPAVIIPYANADENNHGPNENIRIDCVVTGAHTIAQIIFALGERQRNGESYE